MNFDWSKEQLAGRKQVEEIFDRQAVEELAAWEEADVVMLREQMVQYQRRLAATDYVKLAQGPDRLDEAVQLCAMQEVVAQADTSLFMGVEITARLFGGLLAGYGTQALRDELMNSIHEGNLIAAMAVSDADENQPTVAKSDGDEYVVEGKKDYVSNGPTADLCAVLVDLEGKPAFCVVKAGQPGLKPGPRISTMGCRGLAVCSLELQGARIPKEYVLGPFPDNRILDYVRLMEGIMLMQASIGLSRRLFDDAVIHCKARRRGGRPIIAYQEVGFQLAEMLTLVQTSEWYGRRATWLASKNDAETATFVHCAKVFCAETAEQVARMAMQVSAGKGFVSGSVPERGFRDAKFASLAGTTNEVARMKIADDVLTKYQV